MGSSIYNLGYIYSLKTLSSDFNAIWGFLKALLFNLCLDLIVWSSATLFFYISIH